MWLNCPRVINAIVSSLRLTSCPSGSWSCRRSCTRTSWRPTFITATPGSESTPSITTESSRLSRFVYHFLTFIARPNGFVYCQRLLKIILMLLVWRVLNSYFAIFLCYMLMPPEIVRPFTMPCNLQLSLLVNTTPEFRETLIQWAQYYSVDMFNSLIICWVILTYWPPLTLINCPFCMK